MKKNPTELKDETDKSETAAGALYTPLLEVTQ